MELNNTTTFKYGWRYLKKELTGFRSTGEFVRCSWWCVSRGSSRGHLVRHVHLYGVASFSSTLVRERVGARFAAGEVSLHPLKHGQHRVGGGQSTLGWSLGDVWGRDTEGGCHTFEGLELFKQTLQTKIGWQFSLNILSERVPRGSNLGPHSEPFLVFVALSKQINTS